MHQYVEFHPSRKSTQAGGYKSFYVCLWKISSKMQAFLDVKLILRGKTLEEQASFLVEKEFMPAGFELVRWTKLPYLCEGDFNRVSPCCFRKVVNVNVW